MALSTLDDKSVVPNESILSDVLGEAFKIWKDIIKFLQEKCGDIQEVWKFTGQKYGWSFRIKYKKRTILYLGPRKEYFMAVFIFGEKAVAAAEKSALPEFIIDMIRSAKKYMEGRVIRIEVRQQADIKNIEKLVEIKLAN